MSAREMARTERTTPRLPEPLTVESLRTLMREPPYWDVKHPRSALYRRLVDRGFAMLFPGNATYDETGKTIDVPPLPPEAVAHQVAAANREMDRLERDLQGSDGGTVHVRAHTRVVDGKVVEVDAYEREAPEGGGRQPEDSTRPPATRAPDRPEFQTLPDVRGRDRAKPEPLGPARMDEDLRDIAVNMADDAQSNDKDEEDKNRTDDDRTKEARSRLPAPDSREPVDPEEFYRNIDFDPNGENRREAALRRPLDALHARALRNTAEDAMKDEYPGVIPHNNEADAFRHAHWSFETARDLGPDVAKMFGDAHERSVPDPPTERLMDLYNNKVGRDLAADPNNAERDARDVIREAIREGKLRTRPFEVAQPRSPLPDRPPGVIYGRSRNPRVQP